MKKFFNILITVVLATLTVLTATACTTDNNSGANKKGLLLKKIDGIYTIYKYVDEGEGKTELDIGAELAEQNISENINIKAGAFDGNNTLVKIIVPSNVNEIAEGAFRNMQALQSLEVPFIGKTLNADAFYKESASDADKAVDKARTIAHFFGTSEYDAGRQITIKYSDSGSATCYVPVNFDTIIVNATKAVEGKTCYSIPMHAFDGAINLKNVTLKGDKLGAIGESAFSGCINLKEIDIPATVKTVYKKAFGGCAKLENVILNGSIELKEQAFSGCSAIKYMGAKVETAPAVQTIDLANVSVVAQNALDFANETVTYKVLNAGTLDLAKAFGETKYN